MVLKRGSSSLVVTVLELIYEFKEVDGVVKLNGFFSEFSEYSSSSKN